MPPTLNSNELKLLHDEIEHILNENDNPTHDYLPSFINDSVTLEISIKRSMEPLLIPRGRTAQRKKMTTTMIFWSNSILMHHIFDELGYSKYEDTKEVT